MESVELSFGSLLTNDFLLSSSVLNGFQAKRIIKLISRMTPTITKKEMSTKRARKMAINNRETEITMVVGNFVEDSSRVGAINNNRDEKHSNAQPMAPILSR